LPTAASPRLTFLRGYLLSLLPRTACPRCGACYFLPAHRERRAAPTGLGGQNLPPEPTRRVAPVGSANRCPVPGQMALWFFCSGTPSVASHQGEEGRSTVKGICRSHALSEKRSRATWNEDALDGMTGRDRKGTLQMRRAGKDSAALPLWFFHNEPCSI